MTDREIIERLYYLGHFRNPVNHGRTSWGVKDVDVPNLELVDEPVRQAVASYQSFLSVNLEPLVRAEHNRRLIADGDVGPATVALLAQPRCNVPDFLWGEEEATGSGSWPSGCYADFENHHALRMYIDKGRMPSFLGPVFEAQVWPNVQESYREIGIMLVRVESAGEANLTAEWVVPDGGWIGLAIVPGRTSCGTRIWQKYDLGYRPSNVVNEWITLFKHEIGHNLNLQHTSGGVMNPGIIRGLPVTWKNVGDPSEPILRRYFGGEAVPRVDEGPRYWTHQGLFDEETGERLLTPLHPPVPRVA